MINPELQSNISKRAYEIKDLSFVLDAPEISPGIRETTIDYQCAPEHVKDFIIGSINAAVQGRSYNPSLFDRSTFDWKTPETRKNSYKKITSYVIPEQMLIFSKENFDEDKNDFNKVYEKKIFENLLLNLPSNDPNAEYLEYSKQIAEQQPRWKLVSKSNDSKNFILLSPIDNCFDGSQMINLFNSDGLANYLDLSQKLFIYLSRVSGSNNPMIDRENLISNLINLTASINSPNSKWRCFQLIHKQLLKNRLGEEAFKEIDNSIVVKFFDPNYGPENSKVILEELKKIYKSKSEHEIPTILTTSQYQDKTIHSYFLGLSPSSALENIPLLINGIEALTTIFPDISESLPKRIRIFSTHKFESDCLGFFANNQEINLKSIYVMKSKDKKYEEKSFRHEITHLYISEKYSGLTGNPYIDEGIAEYYGKYLSKVPQERLKEFAVDILDNIDTLNNLKSCPLAYEVGPLFINFLNETIKEDFIFDILRAHRKYAQKNLDIKINLKTKLNSPAIKTYFILMDKFIEYIEKLAK